MKQTLPLRENQIEQIREILGIPKDRNVKIRWERKIKVVFPPSLDCCGGERYGRLIRQHDEGRTRAKYILFKQG